MTEQEIIERITAYVADGDTKDLKEACVGALRIITRYMDAKKVLDGDYKDLR